jgi:hypothetical protein
LAKGLKKSQKSSSALKKTLQNIQLGSGNNLEQTIQNLKQLYSN